MTRRRLDDLKGRAVLATRIARPFLLVRRSWRGAVAALAAPETGVAALDAGMDDGADHAEEHDEHDGGGEGIAEGCHEEEGNHGTGLSTTGEGLAHARASKRRKRDGWTGTERWILLRRRVRPPPAPGRGDAVAGRGGVAQAAAWVWLTSELKTHWL